MPNFVTNFELRTAKEGCRQSMGTDQVPTTLPNFSKKMKIE
jgi:hypothetical protein